MVCGAAILVPFPRHVVVRSVAKPVSDHTHTPAPSVHTGGVCVQPYHSAVRFTIASWYGPGFVGRERADGTLYKKGEVFAANKTLPLGTKVKVTDLQNHRSIVLPIKDRGPYVKGRGLDLSEEAAVRLGMRKRGLAYVAYQVVQ